MPCNVIPSSASSTIAANIRGVSSEFIATTTTCPSPWLPPRNSPITAPITANTMAVSAPVRTDGAAVGRSRLRSTCHRDAPS